MSDTEMNFFSPVAPYICCMKHKSITLERFAFSFAFSRCAIVQSIINAVWKNPSRPKTSKNSYVSSKLTPNSL